MKFSVFNGMPYGRTRMPGNKWPVPNQYFEPDQARRAVAACLEEVAMEDELGFDWIACAEHHYSPFNLAPNVTVLASALTQHVKRAKIAILGALIPLTGNPVRIAEEYAMIDNLSGGRLVAGLLRGAPYEYLVYNVNPAESRTRFEEAWDLIIKAWTDRMPFGWEGKYYHYRNVSIWPRPLQAPTPPIYVSGSSKESGEFAARKKVGLGLAFTNMPLAAEAAKHYRAKCDEYGWEPTAEQIIYQLPIHVGETDEQAFEAVRPMFGHTMPPGGLSDMNRLVATSGFFGKGDSNLVARFKDLSADEPRSLEEALERGTVICGGPKTVLAQVKRLNHEIGCGMLNLIFDRSGAPDKKRRSIELFATEVMPAAREI
jgi:alkanesulfonate monooxygenase SsuD/methylene tetrahydromethanopterin reductase-like flavin-dependent oxidoreductase (luciferase family)